MNRNIEKYLDLYLEKENVEYATLLTGNWGCGKTYFIKNYIENIKGSKKDKYKFVYVSLFGLKDVSSVNEVIFQELHPILSHKGMKILGGVLSSAIKLGFKFDLIGDQKEETTINIDLNKINPFDKNSNYENLIFIFDDLERTRVPLSEIFGFISSLCEKTNLKVIVIANEREIKDEIYGKFKEKVIGKSFEIQNDLNSYWNLFKKINPNLESHIVTIQSVFDEFGDSNYRNLNQTTDNYNYFSKGIDEQILKHNDFVNILIKQFYTLSLIYKKENSIDKPLKYLKEKYPDFYYSLLFNEDTWKIIITSFLNSYEHLNNLILSLPLFNKKETQSWQYLWNYRELNDDEFHNNMNDVKSKFTEEKYDHIGELMHAVSLLIFFYKNNLISEPSINDIEKKLKEYVKKYLDNGKTQNIDLIRFNGTGLCHIGENDKDFIRIRDSFYKDLKKQNTTIKEKNLIDDFLSSIELVKNGNWNDLYKISERYEFIPLLNSNHADIVINKLGDNFTSLYNLCYFLSERYKENHRINGVPLSIYLKSEEPFVEKLIKIISIKFKFESLSEFENFKVSEIINMLEEIKGRFNRG